jgi:hypothetical protein
MSHYTISLGHILRGFSETNKYPQLYASPRSIIETSYQEFFKAVGEIPIEIFGDERDEQFATDFKKMFLEHFYMREIGYQTVDAFLLELGNFFRRKLPTYSLSWREILEGMYATNTNENKSNNTMTSNGDTDGWSTSDGEGHSKSVADQLGQSGVSDTPQNELNLDVHDIDYATSVTNSESKSGSQSDNSSHTTGHTNTKSTNESVSANDGESKGRNTDVFSIYSKWVESGYDLFTPLFREVMREQIFLPFN